MNDFTQTMKTIAEKVINAGQQQIRDNNSNASGKLIESFEFITTDNMIIISFLDYGGYLDVKTGPSQSKDGDGFYDKIKEWTKFKGIPIGAAWPIYRKILEEGTEAKPWIFKMDEVALNLAPELLEYLSATIHDKVLVDFEKLWLKK